jgi:plastocyanin
MNNLHGDLADIVSRYQNGRIDRRSALKLLGGLGLAAVAVPALGGPRAVAQDAASPEAMATPIVGPQADGTNLWKVQVGGMDMANGIDVHGFFPGALTINAGDSVYFQFAPMGMPGFHTVTFASGGEAPPLLMPDVVDGTPVASPEGPPRLVINQALAFPDGRTSYDGTGLLNSGLDVFRMEAGPTSSPSTPRAPTSTSAWSTPP